CSWRACLSTASRDRGGKTGRGRDRHGGWPCPCAGQGGRSGAQRRLAQDFSFISCKNSLHGVGGLPVGLRGLGFVGGNRSLGPSASRWQSSLHSRAGWNQNLRLLWGAHAILVFPSRIIALQAERQQVQTCRRW